jgi:hypothetical protein
VTEEKKQRLISAGTALSVIMLFVLIVVLAYQLIAIGVKKKQKDLLVTEITRLNQEIENAEEGVALWQTEWKIEERARQLDYVYKKDKENDDK